MNNAFKTIVLYNHFLLFQIVFGKAKMFSDLIDDDLLLGSLMLPSPTLTKTMVNINNNGEYIKPLEWTHGISNNNYL